MIARRTVILFTAASLGLAATGANASEDLLGDILRGVADAFTRDYIRHHYRDGHWDGRHWWYDGRRFTVVEYRRFLIGRAGPRPPAPPRPMPPRPPKPHGPGFGPGPGGLHPDPGRPGFGPGPGGGPHPGRPGFGPSGPARTAVPTEDRRADRPGIER